MLLINGTPTTGIDARDRGLNYGDGLFETLALLDGQPRLWLYHMRRLEHGCRRLGLPLPDTRLLADELAQLYRQYTGNDRQRLVAKIIITRGQGGRGYRPVSAEPTRIVSVSAWPLYPRRHDEGIQVRWCRTRLGQNPQLAGLKHLNRLEQVLASQEWDDDDIAEGLMLDQQGHVIEGTRSNLFVISRQTLVTAPLSECGIAGVVREIICTDVIGHGLPVTVRPLSIADVVAADEAFLCNSIIGIWPIIRIVDVRHAGRFAVGPLTRHLRQCFRQYADTVTDAAAQVNHVR